MRGVIVVLAALFALPVVAEEPKGTAIPADALKWHDMTGNRSGVSVAEVKGEFQKGPWAGFVKAAAGNKGLHTHSVEMKIVIVSGTFMYGPTAETEKPYGPGSYIVIPANWPHTNSQPGEVVMFIEQAGKYDSKAVTTTPAKATPPAK